MALVAITHQSLYPDGTPVPHAKVRLTPIQSGGQRGGLIRSADDSEVSAQETWDDDGQGSFSFSVYPNTDFKDPNGWYEVVESGPGYGPITWYARITGAGTLASFAYNPNPVVNAVIHGAPNHQGDILPDGSEQTLGTGSLTLLQRTAASVPTPPAGGRAHFVDSADGHAKVKLPDGSVVDIEAGGSSGLTGGTPALTFDTTNSAGSGTVGIRANAQIALFDATTPAASAVGDAGGTGSAGKAARRDHSHPRESFGTPSAITPDASPAAGSNTTIPRSDHQHGMATYASTPAAIGTGAAGTSGAAPSRGDHVHPTGAGTPSTQAFGDAAATGSGPAAAMTDHKHAMPDSTAGPDADVTVDAAGAAGTIHTAARSGHGHKVATYASTPTAIGTGAAGTSGDAPARGSHVHATGAGTPTNSAVGDSAATGAGPAAAMTNHVHGRESFATPGSSAVGDSASAGSATTIPRSDHVHGRESFATPVSTGAANAAGSATTIPRSDHVHAIGSGSVGNGLTLTSGVLSTIMSTAASADVTTSESTTSTSYADLTTVGPSVTVTIGPSGAALVLISAKFTNAAAGTNGAASLSVDGATPVDADSCGTSGTANIGSSRPILVPGLSAGSHTFKMQYKSSSGASAATMSNRRILVLPL